MRLSTGAGTGYLYPEVFEKIHPVDDIPLIWWLMPRVIVPEDIAVWIRDRAPCWLGGYCR